jgi:hypothetical protein
MKDVKQINKWLIKELSEEEIFINEDSNKRFLVFAPNGRLMMDRMTLEQAEKFCKENPGF